MTFKEEFPSLKVVGYPLVLRGEYDMCKDVFGQFVNANQVQKQCLDKQRVKEVVFDECGIYQQIAEDILKRLGLEDEE